MVMLTKIYLIFFTKKYLTMFNFIFNVFFSEIINIIIIILFVLTGGVLPLWERKYLSLVQRRVGPKFVGYKGRLQFIADALKVFFKDYILLFHTNKFFFFLIPILFLNINLIFWGNVVFFNNCIYIHIEYNILFLLFFSLLSNIFIFFVGIFSKNKYTVLTSNRVLNLLFINEIFASSVFLFIFFFFSSFSFLKIIYFKNYLFFIFLFFITIPIFVFLFLLDINKVPFDLTEAESELIMGYHIEYSGFMFGLFVLVEYLHLFFFLYFLYLIFI